jgi:hypothetical protein
LTPETLDTSHQPFHFEPLCHERVGSGDLMPRLRYTAFAALPHEWHPDPHEHAAPIPTPAPDAILKRASLGAPGDTDREGR